MHKITLLSVGSLKSPWINDGVSELFERIIHDIDFAMLTVQASKQKDPQKQRQEESNALLEKLADMKGDVWVLDERGKGYSSEEFSVEIQRAFDRGTPLIVVLGGAYGLTDAVRERADTVIRFSDMTFPHELCHVLFLEQLYRSLSIWKGRGYHHGEG